VIGPAARSGSAAVAVAGTENPMILIISANEDIHAQAVMRELARHDHAGARMLNLSDFPMRLSLNMRFDNNGHCDHELQFPDRTVSMKEVSAVWWRRPQPFGIPAEVKDPAARHFAMSEAATAFQGMWQSSRALWINNIQRDAAASHKPYQLALAKEIGLRIPETLITNDPEEAREFWSALPGQVVYKPFTASVASWRETRVVKPDEERMAESVRLAPVIFQKYVAGRDLRITVIGDRVFPAETDARQGEYHVDVRLNTGLHYRCHELPAAVQEKLLILMRRLGLEYGAIDMRVTPEGEYVFFEVNPAGQFLYVELATGMKIAAALADHLAAGKESATI
jgi:glutathione synthase/RimK-type ligase-like ATP-grasp enzyme